MFRIVGPNAKDLCDAHLRPSRRDILRVGGAGMLGMSLGSLLKLQSVQAAGTAVAGAPAGGGPGWGKAKSVIMVYLQGGPSHLDMWDPKPDAPENIRSTFKNIGTKLPGVSFTEILPKLAEMNDRFTMIRSMAYTPNGLFNHTAAIYQMMTGYTTDKVSPSGQLEPPNGQDFPNFGSQIVRLHPPTEPMLPFVMLPRPLQESNVVGKGGSAGFLGKAFDPYTLFPMATTWTWRRWIASRSTTSRCGPMCSPCDLNAARSSATSSMPRCRLWRKLSKKKTWTSTTPGRSI